MARALSARRRRCTRSSRASGRGRAQCGFCTAGMIMAAAGLLEATPDPTEAEIRAGTLPCTGYVKIIRAVELPPSGCARRGPDRERRSAARPARPSADRHAVPKLDAVEKVTGAGVPARPRHPGHGLGKILPDAYRVDHAARHEPRGGAPGVLGVGLERRAAFGCQGPFLLGRLVRRIRDEVRQGRDRGRRR
jgi:hypothetical protein